MRRVGAGLILFLLAAMLGGPAQAGTSSGSGSTGGTTVTSLGPLNLAFPPQPLLTPWADHSLDELRQQNYQIYHHYNLINIQRAVRPSDLLMIAREIRRESELLARTRARDLQLRLREQIRELGDFARGQLAQDELRSIQQQQVRDAELRLRQALR